MNQFIIEDPYTDIHSVITDFFYTLGQRNLPNYLALMVILLMPDFLRLLAFSIF